MNKKYLVSDCGNKNDSKIHLFQVPFKAYLNEEWNLFFDENKVSFPSDKKLYLCENHFMRSMINRRNKSRVRLMPGAFPIKVNIHDFIQKFKN